MRNEYWINGRWYNREILINGEYGPVEDYLRQALHFCSQWLRGRNEFSQKTSGSTGVPKTILIKRRQMEASAACTCKALALKAEMHALVCVNVQYIAGKMMLVRCLEQGMHMTIVPPTGNPLSADILFPLHFAAMVPLQVENTLHQNYRQQLSQIDHIIIGGAPVQPQLRLQIQELPNNFYATYGMTETVSHIALQKLNGSDQQDYFQAFPEVKIGQDERGCLTIESVLTNHKKIVSNDIVEILTTDRFRWLGRADHVINSGGVKIQIEQLEASISKILHQHQLMLNFIIAGQPEEKLGEQVIMVVEDAKESDNLKQILKKYLPPFHVPKKIIVLPKFAKTASGKVDRLIIKQKINEANL